MSLQQRIKKIETQAQPMIEARERFIKAYIAECRKRGLDTTREHAEDAHAFRESEMVRLSHLPMPERLRQTAINYAVQWYCKKTGKSEEEARPDLLPYVENLLNHEFPKIENQEYRNRA
jgi:hypothetical protein